LYHEKPFKDIGETPWLALKEFYFADKSGAYLNGEKISVREVPVLNAFYAVIGGNLNGKNIKIC
jgi:hypothetical protein